jgi:hypothetical protein
MVVARLWCRVSVVGPGGGIVAGWIMERSGDPDLGTVDELARLMLAAARLGGGVVVTERSPRLHELLDLAGLPVQMEREPEGGEEPLRVQGGEEEVHGGDLPR